MSGQKPSSLPPPDLIAINAVLIAVRQAAHVLCDRATLLVLLHAHGGACKYVEFSELLDEPIPRKGVNRADSPFEGRVDFNQKDRAVQGSKHQPEIQTSAWKENWVRVRLHPASPTFDSANRYGLEALTRV